jgi:hypothetical protein
MADLTTDQVVVLVRDAAMVLLWAGVALAVTPRLRQGGWASLALVGSILLLVTSGLSLVQAKFLFVDHDPSLTLTLADWHLSRVPILVTFLGSVLLVKAVLADRRPRAD